MRSMNDLIGPVDPLARALPEGSDVFYMLRRIDSDRARRIAASLPDPVDRAVGEALAEIEEGKRVGPRRRLEQALAQDPDHTDGRAARLRLSAGAIADGADPEKLVRPPLSEAERALVAGWVARAQDSRGEALRALETELARIPLRHPLGADAVRLRVQARLYSGEPALLQEAVALAEATLGDRPDPSSILLRAEAGAAVGDHVAVLETLGELLDKLDPRRGSSRAQRHRARELARATPNDPELYWLRSRTLRRLGAMAEPLVARREAER